MRTIDLDPDYSLDAYRSSIDAFTGRYRAAHRDRARAARTASFFPVEVSVARLRRRGRRIRLRSRTRHHRAQADGERAADASRSACCRRSRRSGSASRASCTTTSARRLATVGVLLRSLECTPERDADLPPGPRSRQRSRPSATSPSRWRASFATTIPPSCSSSASRTPCARTRASSRSTTRSPYVWRRPRSAGVLDHDRELHLYRIVQEALANVARHARATRVAVRLQRHRAHVVLTVRDDGVGIAAGQMRSPGLGLVTMRERAQLMHAVLRIRTLRRGGTEVRVAVPIAGEQSTATAGERAAHRPPARRPIPASRGRRVSAGRRR